MFVNFNLSLFLWAAKFIFVVDYKDCLPCLAV